MQCRKKRSICGVAAEKNGFALAPEDISVVTAIQLTWPAAAPVFDFDGSNLQLAFRVFERKAPAPWQLGNLLERRSCEDVSGEGGSHGENIGRQTRQRGQIHVVHVSV